MTEQSTVRIPADIDQDDRLLAGLTARQLSLLAIPVVVVWALYMGTRQIVPLFVFAPVAIVAMGVMGTLVVAKRDGVSLDRLVVAALRHQRGNKQFVPTEGDVLLPLGVSALGLPLLGVSHDGVIDLGADGSAVLLDARAVNLALQSEREQQATVAAFGRFCNSLATPAQFCIHSEPVDLLDAARVLELQAPSLPAIGLETAARDHADFLRSLSSRHDVLRRSVLVVLRDPRPTTQATAILLRQAEDATALLRLAGIEAAVLDGDAAGAAIQRASAPNGAKKPLTNDDIVRGV